jgi:hypothetical protein
VYSVNEKLYKRVQETIIKNARDCTFYIAFGETLRKEIANELNVSEGEVKKELDRMAVLFDIFVHTWKPSRQNRQGKKVSDWQKEQAIEAGMLHGVDAYNEVMSNANKKT